MGNLSEFVDERKQFISKRIMQCVVWLLNESKSGSKQSNLFLSNLYSPIIEEVQQRKAQRMELLMKNMQNDEKNEHAVIEDVNIENMDLLLTERVIEDAILEFIVIDNKKKKNEHETKQSVLDRIYAFDISEYLAITS